MAQTHLSIYLSLYLRGSEGLEGEIGFALPFSDRPTILPPSIAGMPASQPPPSLAPSVWAESASASGQGRYLGGLCWAGVHELILTACNVTRARQEEGKLAPLTKHPDCDTYPVGGYIDFGWETEPEEGQRREVAPLVRGMNRTSESGRDGANLN